jgi:hypothetical protein
MFTAMSVLMAEKSFLDSVKQQSTIFAANFFLRKLK